MNIPNAPMSSSTVIITSTVVAVTTVAAPLLEVVPSSSGFVAPLPNSSSPQLAEADLQRMAEAIARIIRREDSQPGNLNPLNLITTGVTVGAPNPLEGQ